MQKISTSVWVMISLVIGAVAVIGFALYANDRKFADVTLPIEVTEYFDYQCIHCARFHPDLRAAKEEFGDKIVVNLRHFPILGDSSVAFAYAAEAAREQDKFMEYHDAVFDTYNAVTAGEAEATDLDPVKIAELVGLDIAKFETDRVSDAIKVRVDADIAAGNAAGVTGTPTIYAAGQLVDYTKFSETITKLVDIAEQNSQN